MAKWYKYERGGYSDSVICRECEVEYDIGIFGEYPEKCPDCGYVGDHTEEILERLQRLEDSMKELTRMVREIGKKVRK